MEITKKKLSSILFQPIMWIVAKRIHNGKRTLSEAEILELLDYIEEKGEYYLSPRPHPETYYNVPGAAYIIRHDICEPASKYQSCLKKSTKVLFC